MAILKSPITYFGGKGLMRSHIVPLIESIEHMHYVEPFGGGASVLLAKKPSRMETYNDIDHRVVALFRTLRDPEQFDKFERFVALTPYSRECWEEAAENMNRTDLEQWQQAAWYFIAARLGFGGRSDGSFGMSVTSAARGMPSTNSRYLKTVEMLPALAARFMRVQIECVDFRRIFEIYDSPDTLFYCDPPYVLETRVAGGYVHELENSDHHDLVKLLLAMKGKAILSGYAHPIYKPLEDAGWERTDVETASMAAGRTKVSNLQGKGAALANAARTESIWVMKGADRQFRMAI